MVIFDAHEIALSTFGAVKTDKVNVKGKAGGLD
jgi:hypothetical protein